MIKEYLLQNWALLLIIVAFAIALKVTVFLEKRTLRHFYAMIVEIFVLSIAVFVEFYLTDLGGYALARTLLMALRYSATPIIIAQVIYSLVKKSDPAVFIPAAALTVIDIVSIFTGIVFSVDGDGVFHRGPLGILPFIMAGAYSIIVVYVLYRNSNKRAAEVIPIVFLAIALTSGVVLPFLLGPSFSHIFCTTIAIALFVYYVFLIIQVTKKDPLTGLLNRQAYYADIESDPESITALILIDMNGLKTLNDTQGHAAGDEALAALGLCFMRALRRGESAYRVGGDEFVIICRRVPRDEVAALADRIRKNVADTEYGVSLGYSCSAGGKNSIDDMLRESDEMMYIEKACYYKAAERD
ncbi:MAG: GGDEF domain-containing protein [Clostridia bacterium]|nr:GGDEF domain-containing protein [Clostridia bacterium]